ncbi:MAG: hypothetical protein Q8J72_04940, partial [Rhodocyclaceae bacterium]|nr:hypothetical protein [Rhodocyclaceae bacterium]
MKANFAPAEVKRSGRNQKSALAGRRLQRNQRGAALLIFLVLLVMGGLTYLVNSFSPEMIAAMRQKKTEAALAQAKDALIGYALQYRDHQNEIARVGGKPLPNFVYGYLPLPDFGESVNLNTALANQTCTSEGCSKINPAGLPATDIVVGRFPWKTLGTEPLRDGYGECLWYAVTTTHRAINSTANIMNWDTLASPDILIGSGKLAFDPGNEHDRPIAVIFSPGPAFTTGGRYQSPDAPECGGNYEHSLYINPAINNAQHALPITSDTLFGALRRSSVRETTNPINRSPSFVDDINDMLDQMVTRARDKTPAVCASANNKISDDCSIALDT